MNITEVFELLKQKNKIALLSYMVAGYPDLETSYKAFDILLENGSDMIEIGFPFSDPVADGPTIQEAHTVALQNGITHKDIFNLSKSLKTKHKDKPFLLMTYFNPIFKIGLDKFFEEAKESGIDGFIIPDLPAEEAQGVKDILEQKSLSLVMLLAPTSFKNNRVKSVCKMSTDFVYMVSITGITGARDKLPIESIKEYAKAYKEHCHKPIVLGFGISTKEHVDALKHYVDGVVVGSHFVKSLKQRGLEGLKEETKKLSEATYL
ncbi:tryptophan synthase subunit alpha [Hydrogenobaculum sp.]|nr:MAG: tryptophan synthase subunit alpha [Hydrogenobaculum sp.]HEK24759.1 tryptophan synthase subunit alpha [Hydrogenobaculum sp.]